MTVTVGSHPRLDKGHGFLITGFFGQDRGLFNDTCRTSRYAGHTDTGRLNGFFRIALLQQQVHQIQIIPFVLWRDFHQVPEQSDGLLFVATFTSFLITFLQTVNIIPLHGGIIRIDLPQPPEQAGGFFYIALFPIKFYLLPPKSLPVRVNLQKLIDITNGTGIVSGFILHLNKQLFGFHILRVVPHRPYKEVTGSIIILLPIMVTTAKFIQAIDIRIDAQTFIQQLFAGLPLLSSEHRTHVRFVIIRRMYIIFFNNVKRIYPHNTDKTNQTDQQTTELPHDSPPFSLSPDFSFFLLPAKPLRLISPHTAFLLSRKLQYPLMEKTTMRG